MIKIPGWDLAIFRQPQYNPETEGPKNFLDNEEVLSE